jgi:O-antigen/teichoic acid export membrane protein
MSATKRIISGSIAAWVQIIVNLLIQFSIVPIFLKFWSVKMFSIWITLQTITSIMTIPDRSHSAFVGFEMLKIGKKESDTLRLKLWSGFIICLLIGFLNISITLLIIKTNFLKLIFEDNMTFQESLDAGTILLIFNASNIFGSCVSGFLIKSLIVFDYYPRMAWWGVLSTALTSTIPIIGVIIGLSMIDTAWLLCYSIMVFYILVYFDIITLLKRHKLTYVNISLIEGFSNFKKSIVISLRDILENFRQQGVRILLAPLAGSYGLIAFTTMRTGANVALQGLSTITNPLMPELIRYLHAKEQEKFEASLGTVWIIIVCVLCPSIIVLQVFVEPLFIVWTRNKIVFDSVLFALLSMGVIIYGLAQPAIAVVIGNNLLKPQILISILTALIVIVGMFLLIPIMNIVGVGTALLLAEIVSLFYYKNIAKNWLDKHGLKWPVNQFNLAVLQAIIVAISMFLLINYFDYKYLILFLSLIIQLYLISVFWSKIPQIVTVKFGVILRQIPIISFFIK